MSSIPSSAMHHAKAPHPDDEDGHEPKPEASVPPAADRNDTVHDEASGGGVLAALKAHPVAAMAVGATVVAGAVAAVAAPLLRDSKPAKAKAPTRKPVAKKPAAKKPAARKKPA